MKVLAALDQTAGARTVLATSHEIARLFAAEVSALHVLQDGVQRVRELVADDRVPLAELKGAAPGARLAQALDDDDDAVALVVGTRPQLQGGREIGSTALEVVTTAHKPVFIIPPELSAGFAVRRVLVPLEGSLSTSKACAALDVPGAEHVDVVILHVLEEHALPPFSDQPQHEWEAFGREFLARYSPLPVAHVRLETRVGRPDQHILPVARETDCDLIVLAWAQKPAPGRASIVRDTLRRGTIPVLLVPVKAAVEARV
jgi:nucleotide-binding universal stress UspA family protein